MLKRAIDHLIQIQKDAAELQREAEEELARRRKWNEDFNERVSKNPLVGEGGVPGFSKDDPIL